MFFASLLVLVWALFANGVVPDKFGWLMLMAVGWFAGFMDCQWIHRKKSDADQTMPPDNDGPPETSDSGMFRA